MKLIFKYFSQYRVLLLFFAFFNGPNLFAAGEKSEFEYIQIEPIIVTNYQKKSPRKQGFVQIKAEVTVKGKESVTKLLLHMPLVRDFVIEFLSFTDEKVIKDITKRKELRANLTTGIKAMLTKEIGEPLIEELIFTHFMWD